MLSTSKSIIYAPAFLVLLEQSEYRGNGGGKSGGGKSGGGKSGRGSSSNSGSAVVSVLQRLFNRDRVVFGLVSGGVFLSLGALFYSLFGYEFLYETYLYHLIRKDNRHNFSVYFYDLYLGFSGGAGTSAGASALGSHTLAFLPQFGVALALALRFGKDLPFALATQTMAFVTFNKVRRQYMFLPVARKSCW